jgi:protein-tyrosine phosphatase
MSQQPDDTPCFEGDTPLNKKYMNLPYALLPLTCLLMLGGCEQEPPIPVTTTEATPPAISVPVAIVENGAGRSLGIASIPNLRGMGGYTTEAGEIVVGGLLYRANQLSDISEADMQKLAALELATDYDLRTAEERDKRPDELPAGVEYIWLDVLADSPQAGPAQLEELMSDAQAANEALGGGRIEEKFKNSYREFVSLPSARREFGNFFLGIGDADNLPAVFHCTTGKDRTGWAAAALLTLLGVPRETVNADYLRSNDYILTAYAPVIDGFVAAGGDAEIIKAILGVKQEYLDAAFDEMETQYGTIENYFSEGLGIDAEQQAALRELYVK